MKNDALLSLNVEEIFCFVRYYHRIMLIICDSFLFDDGGLVL